MIDTLRYIQIEILLQWFAAGLVVGFIGGALLAVYLLERK